ncbi:hypothetical protein FOC4_g10002462 [Fusarium odoratissimum]|uniref:Uncharacterized protein n=1 Tax=Fusarium oxysporum f. sp. cubense (strain race 4) TaxID=2502994 RepID=N1S950_FUSC4|nr:hypothetical protein FOC4_g10002462 [Fusarium odoratissimum]
MASNGQLLTKGSRAQYLLDITFYGPTIFPILFAAIVGRALKALATWELQRGSTIGHIETLSSSTTLIGAIVTQIQLRNLNLVAIALIVLWALSPVGGQASLRVLRSGTRITKTNHQFQALDPVSSWNAGSSTSYPILAHALFTSSLITTKKFYNKPQDSWGNLRIPIVEAFDNYQSHAWIKLPDNATEVTFSSLIGVPVNPGLPSEPTFLTLSTSYMYLDCPTFHTSPLERDQWQQYEAPPWTNFTADPPSLENSNDTWAHYHTFTGDGGPIVAKGFQIALSTCLGICSHRLVPREAPPPDGVFYEDVTSIGKAKFQERLSQLFNTLFLAGIQPSAITAITLVPDVLGTLSMITLDNQCDKELRKASMLDGLERSRLLKKVSIKLGNVEQNGLLGRIGFSAPAYNEEGSELHENGLYE